MVIMVIIAISNYINEYLNIRQKTAYCVRTI